VRPGWSPASTLSPVRTMCARRSRRVLSPSVGF
jgi:hypothetical protein